MLYSPGAFFFYPYKPLAHLLWGDSYAVAYKHFRRDHSSALNLVLHVVALSWQLLGNFGLLGCVDDLLHPHVTKALPWLSRPLSTSTALLWSATLLASPAPRAASLISSFCIGAACAVSPVLEPRRVECASMVAYLSALVVSKLKWSGAQGLKGDIFHACKYFGLLLFARLAGARWHDALSAKARALNVGLAFVMVALGSLSKPTVPAVVGGALLARPLGELTGQDWLLFYGAAFAAQVSQGVAHDVSRQKATLLSHEESTESRRVKLAFEWSHVVYFPNLLLHSCLESLTDRRV